MSSTSSHTHIAARSGRWSARHKKTAITGWLVFVIAAVVLGGMAGFKERTTNDGVGESGRADQVLDRSFAHDDGRETVLVEHPILRSDDTAFRDTVADVVRRLKAEASAREVAVGPVSRDGHAQTVTFRLKGDVDDTLDAVHAAGAAHSSFHVGQFGEASLEKAQGDTMGKDFQRAEKLSIPLTLVILVIAFGSLVAALVPLALALSAVAAALGLVQLATHIGGGMDDTVNSVVLLVGLAVGVDYSLFYLRREREERAAGRGARAAIEAAAATSGHAVLVSGLTVVIAMAGMYLAGNAVFTSLATGSIIVVAVAMLASVTVLPALLAALGHRVEKGRVPVLGRRTARESRAWGFVLERVLRRPAISLVVALAILGGLTIPALGMHTALPGLDSMAKGTDAADTYQRLQKAFPGDANAATVVVQARDVTAPGVQAGIEKLGGTSMRVNADRTVAAVRLPLAGNGTNDASVKALEHLREEVIPASGLKHAQVTGLTAGSTDFTTLMRDRAPIVFAFVLGLAFLLLLVTFRSLVIPVKAILLNLLSVGAAYGVLTIVFQHAQDEPITAWLPMFLFVILFGLSMDYHVFILSRIREGVLGGRRTEDAVSHGIRSTAGVVTSAAVVMVAAFGVFATLSSVEFQEMGVGLAAAVLIDATIVRAVALPAAMKLLGEWNWWLPGRGRRARVAKGTPAWEHPVA